MTLESSLDDVLVTGTLARRLVGRVPPLPRARSPTPLRVAVDERYAAGGRATSPTPSRSSTARSTSRPMVREELLLGIPDAPLCRPDCAGLCPACGADLGDGPCGCDRSRARRALGVLDQLREQ